MNVPLLDVKAHIDSLQPQLTDALNNVVAHARFIMGPEVEALEQQIAGYLGVPHAVACASGTDALLLSLKALDIGPGDEVITTPFTFFATAGAIANVGAKPVFVDIDDRTFNIDPSCIERALTDRTRAIIPVHLFGQCADMTPIMAIARDHNLSVIEDAAQSIGATYDGRMSGAIGHTGCFSFFPSKNLGGIGDGGMITTHDEMLAQKLRLIRQHGAQQRYYHSLIGTNSRLDTLQAAALLVSLPHLDAWAEARCNHANRYSHAFGSIDAIRIPEIDPCCGHVFNQYTLRVQDRDDLMKYLADRQIGAAIYYPVCLHLQECFAHLGYEAGSLPISEQAAQEVVSIPVYPELSYEQQSYVIDAIIHYYQ